MGRGRGVGKTIALFFLLIILVLFGIIWFDYIGLINAKKIFAPIYNFVGLKPQVSETVNNTGVPPNLDNDRIAKRLEALEMRTQELDKREGDIATKEQQIAQIVQELGDRQKSQEEREKTFNNTVKKYDDREVNIVQNALNLTGMRPEKAVDILLAMDDQDMIDVLRKTEEIAQANGASSMVAYWLSLMPPERVATIQRKMTNKPLSIE